MRQIVFDTETTGLDPLQGDRLVEIGCIEIVNGFPTGQTFHRYINPEREMPAAAFAVHGLSTEFLRAHPPFAEIAEDFVAFVGDAPLIAHNASFDLGFLNAELDRAGKTLLDRDRLIDTLVLARRKFPNGPNRLDDLCVRLGVDNSRRTKHGALLDAELLAEVYLELVGARQTQLGLTQSDTLVAGIQVVVARVRPQPLPQRISDAVRAAHRAFVATLGAAAIWRDYLAPEDLTEPAEKT
ncbi:MAG: DNA polymerase III subunit epsilon [Xanthobacteraceae bacterium]